MGKKETSTYKETLKEISLFDKLDDDLKKCREKTKIKPKKVSRLSVKEEKTSLNEDQVESQLKKKVTWEREENLVQIKFFEVVEEERENVFKLKFEEKRKQDARNEKLKLKLASSLQSSTVSSSSSSIASTTTSKTDGTRPEGKCWPKLILLDKSALKLREFGSKSEEKIVQERRSGDTSILLGTDCCSGTSGSRLLQSTEKIYGRVNQEHSTRGCEWRGHCVRLQSGGVAKTSSPSSWSKKSFCRRKYPSGDGNGVQRCGESSGAVYILGSRILQK